VKWCETCLRKLTHHEKRICRRCKCQEERAMWLRKCGLDMDRFLMETTGSKELDDTINKYR
jgi:hypothetical protein